MKITKVESLHADGGWRSLDFLKISTDEGVVGWSEYNESFGGLGVSAVIDGLAPMVIGKEVANASEVFDLMKRARGHRMSKAAIETACWDLEAKKLGVPLWRHIGGTKNEIECGVSIGIQDSVEQLFDKIQTELDAGYQRIKIKIARTGITT